MPGGQTSLTGPIDFEGWVCPAPLRDSPNDRDGPRRRRRDVGRAGRAPVPARVRRGGRRRARRLGGGRRSAARRLAFSTDSFVVKPLFFPGGSIGDLAVNGTVNDLAMAGAHAAGAVDRVHPRGGHRAGRHRAGSPQAMGTAALAAGVRLVTGDTKVVDAGTATACSSTPPGIGARRPTASTSGPQRAAPGDVGDHQRRHRRARGGGDELPRGPGVRHHGRAATPRRCTAWWPRCSPPAPTCTCCATRPAAAWPPRSTRSPRPPASASSSSSATLPIPPEVRDACGLLGLDPLLRGQRGQAGRVRRRRATPTGCWPRCARTRYGARRRRDRHLRGRSIPGMVVARTALGGTRVVDLPIGEQLPRIC